MKKNEEREYKMKENRKFLYWGILSFLALFSFWNETTLSGNEPDDLLFSGICLSGPCYSGMCYSGEGGLSDTSLFSGESLFFDGSGETSVFWEGSFPERDMMFNDFLLSETAEFDHRTGYGEISETSYWRVQQPMSTGFHEAFVIRGQASGAATTAPPVIGTTTTTTSTEPVFSEPVQKVMRFWSRITAAYTYTPKGGGSDGLGNNNLDIRAQFSCPCKLLSQISKTSTSGNQNSGYFFITPGFTFDTWSMNPVLGGREMPSTTFDASLAASIQPQFGEFGVEATIQAGVASAFSKVGSKSFYLRGKGMGTLNVTEDGKFIATGGVIYYCRNRYKLMPSGGVIWKPNENNVWRLVFPDPQLTHFISKCNETDWWAYIRGDIGGGRWYIPDPEGAFLTDYNDYNVGIGAMFDSPCGLTGCFEVGGRFNRELYAYKQSWYKPKSSVYLKCSLAY